MEAVATASTLLRSGSVFGEDQVAGLDRNVTGNAAPQSHRIDWFAIVISRDTLAPFEFAFPRFSMGVA